MDGNERKRLQDEIVQESVAEASQPEQDGKAQGILGIALGIAGLFSPVLIAIFLGALCAILGAYANRQGRCNLGIACGVLAIMNLLSLLIGINVVPYI